MNLWAKEEDLTVYKGDVLSVLPALPDGWVDCVLTSPPYEDMRPEYDTPTDWLRIFEELLRVVNGPMLWNVGRKWVEGCEQMWWLKLLDAAKESGWEHWDTLVWFKPNANPIQGRIATNSHEYVLAFGKPGAEFDEEARRRPYAIGSAERLRRRWVSSVSVKDDDEERSGARRAERRGETRDVNPRGARGSSVLIHTTGKEKGINHPAPMALDLALELVEFVCPERKCVCPMCSLQWVERDARTDTPTGSLPELRGDVHGPVPPQSSPTVLQSNLFEQMDGRAAAEEDEEHEGLHPHPPAGASRRIQGRLRDGASLGDGGAAGQVSGARRGGSSPEREEGRQPRGESRSDGETLARLPAEAASDPDVPALRRGAGPEVHAPTCPECGASGYRRPGVILDPFAGSGTTAIAARMRQCESVMIELSEKYCRELVRRLSTVPRQMTLLS